MQNLIPTHPLDFPNLDLLVGVRLLIRHGPSLRGKPPVTGCLPTNVPIVYRAGCDLQVYWRYVGTRPLLGSGRLLTAAAIVWRHIHGRYPSAPWLSTSPGAQAHIAIVRVKLLLLSMLKSQY